MPVTMDDTAYRRIPGASWTTCIKPLVLGESPAQVRHRIDNPDSGDTASRGYLRAVHCLALQPEVFGRDFLVLPDGMTRGDVAKGAEVLRGGFPSDELYVPVLDASEFTEAQSHALTAYMVAHDFIDWDYITVNDTPRNRRAWREFLEADKFQYTCKSKTMAGARKLYDKMVVAAFAEGKTVLTPTEHRKAQALADAVRAQPMVSDLLAHPDAQPEAVLRWADPIVGPARGRADLLVSPRYILDLKQWRSVQPHIVRRDIQAQGVDAQLAWYARGAEDMHGLHPGTLQRGVIVVTDGGTDGCPECVVVWLDEAMHALGDARLDRALRTYAECDRTGEWPTAGSPEGDLLGPSEWLLKQYHLTEFLNT